MDELNKRVLSVMEFKNLSRTAFTQLLGISLPVLTHISSGRNKPGLELIQKILSHFDDVDPDWLLLGKGNMHRKKPDKVNLSAELREIELLAADLDVLVSNSKQVTEYNRILLKEIGYLHELNQYMTDNESRVEILKRSLTEINQRLSAKVKHEI